MRLEGSLSGPWVFELRQMAEQALARSTAVFLDLAKLRYLDLEGAALLRSLSARNVILLNCSAFVSQQLSEMQP